MDDNEGLRKITRKVLEAAGYEVWESANGASAVTLAKERPDMILQDLVLPDITGYDLVHKLRAACGDPGLPVLAFSSFMEKMDMEWDTSAGFNALVVKPVNAQELLETIQKHIR